jgi:pimeloyl-ACP methyl ester carboxylesterase
MNRPFFLLLGLLAMQLALAEARGSEPVETRLGELVLTGEYRDPGQEGPVFLLLHGTLAHAGMDTIAGLADALEESGYASLSITLSLGESDRQGMYDCAATHVHRHEDAGAELAVWLEWLAARGAGPVVLLGHSRGGNQAARFAVEQHPRLEALVLLAPQTWNADEHGQGYEQRFGAALAPLLAQAEALVAAGRGDELIDVPGFLYCEDARLSAAAFVSYYATDPDMDTPTVIRRSKLPVLVVAGSEDPLTAGIESSLAEQTGAGDIELVLIDGADHFFRDLYAYDVVEAVEAFLADLPPAR